MAGPDEVVLRFKAGPDGPYGGDAPAERARLALEGPKFIGVLQEFDNYLRAIHKHGDDPARADFAHEVRDRLGCMLADAGLELWG